MRGSLSIGVAATALLVGLGVALAQQPPAGNGMQQPQAEGAQKQWQGTESGRAGKEEPSSHLPTDKPPENAVFFHGTLAAPGAAPQTETTPAKWSEQVLARDLIPTMKRPLALNDEQRRRIYDVVSKENKPIAQVNAHPAEFLPPAVELFEMPSELAGAIPEVRDLKYVRLDDRVLLVQPPNKVVVGEIKR
jgi:hypothetical protein